MDRRQFLMAAGTLAAGLGLAGPLAAETAAVALPAPAVPGEKTLEAALRARQSRREFDGRPLDEAVLSGLLWAAWGVNRPESGKRTAPSAMNRQEITIYVAKADGLFAYDAKTHGLARNSEADLRAATGRQPYVGQAPVNLVYVADMGRVAGATADERLELAAVDTGCICQNVSLYCAAMELATVVRASIDKPALAKAMGLAEPLRIVLAQSVGHIKA
jgi:SagB-type dehydrogenase family enzyme